MTAMLDDPADASEAVASPPVITPRSVVYGIVGSRHWYDWKEFYSQVQHQIITNMHDPHSINIVSGGATGVDEMARQFAQLYQRPIRSFDPADEAGSFGERARKRNQKIADAADVLIAMPCACSKGTWMTARMFAARGMTAHIVGVVCDEEVRVGDTR